MKFFIISGSHRPKSQSAKVAGYLQKQIANLGLSQDAEIFELADDALPFWNEGVWENSQQWQDVWSPIAKKLQTADALIVISPEWAGMVPAALKNFFLLTTTKEVGHKPALIVTVSAGGNGVYPVSELRMSSYKNCKVCYIPEHIIVRNAEKMLNDGPSSGKEEDYIRERIDFALKILAEYGKALKTVRDSGVTVNEKFPFGM